MAEPGSATDLFGQPDCVRPNGSLFKWVGNKYRMAREIVSYFPADMGTYYEVFLGSGSVLATLAPRTGVASDSFGPLMEIWSAVKNEPDSVKEWYASRWHYLMSGSKKERYEEIKASYNSEANGADFLFLTRSCYAGIVRFRKRDGYMSTPVGAHQPIKPSTFSKRVDEWHQRVQGTEFRQSDYVTVMDEAEPGAMIYCDPPYSYSQAILYGAQDFSLSQLFESIALCKARGVRIALSIDGVKKSGNQYCSIETPKNLFEREVYINVGKSMLRRFQMEGQTLEDEVVRDRLLLTY